MVNLFKKYDIDNFYLAKIDKYKELVLPQIGDEEEKWHMPIYSYTTILLKVDNDVYVDLKFGGSFSNRISLKDSHTIIKDMEPLNNYYDVRETITASKALKLEHKYHNEYSTKKDFDGDSRLNC